MKIPKKISFAAFCRDILDEPISLGWTVAYKALDGERLASNELETWQALTGRDEYIPRDYRELVAVKGRRAQGTKTATKYLAYRIHTSDFRRYASKGDRLHVPVIAQSRDVAREIMSYLTAFYTNSDLRTEASDLLKGTIELTNGFVISTQTCSYRAPRGITAPLALLDELGVWRSEGADVDREVVRSLTPAMVQFPNRKLILMGSPWIKAGVLFDRWERRFEDGDRLVLHCPTPVMNALIPAEELAREEQSDPQNYRREFLAEWLDDVDSFLPDADIAIAIRTGVREQPFAEALALKPHYMATIDASGLSGKDRFTFAIGHRSVRGNDQVGVNLDLLRGWNRRGVKEVVDEIALTLKAYSLKTVYADQFGFPFLKELLSLRGIEVIQLPWSARNKPEIFLTMKLSLSQGNLKLLDHPESLRELRLLECRRTSGGNSSISAPRGQHDDYACVIAMLNFQCRKNLDHGWGLLATPGQRIREFA